MLVAKERSASRRDRDISRMGGNFGNRGERVMPCDIEVLKQVPLFGLLDDEELAVLAAQVVQRAQWQDGRLFD